MSEAEERVRAIVATYGVEIEFTVTRLRLAATMFWWARHA